MKVLFTCPLRWVALSVRLSVSLFCNGTQAALLAHEPFTNAPGTSIIGSDGGAGFTGAWQANGSSGIATHTGSGLNYTDLEGNILVTEGGAGFFQGQTTANSSMQPIRLFTFSRGADGSPFHHQ